MRRNVVSLEKIGVISQGVDSISDGRLFFLEVTAVDGKLLIPKLRPPTLSELGIKCNNKPVEILGPVSGDSSLSCPKCESIYQRHLVLHTDFWMCCVLSCDNHPFKVIVDLFPKYMEGETHNWQNSFKCFGTPTELPEGVEILNYQRPDEHFDEMKRNIKPAFLLTSEGIVGLKPEMLEFST